MKERRKKKKRKREIRDCKSKERLEEAEKQEEKGERWKETLGCLRGKGKQSEVQDRTKDQEGGEMN